MIRRIPFIPTLIVLAAVAVMVRLGFWQLDRLAEKEALLDRYSNNWVLSSVVAWPREAAALDKVLYRRARIDCRSVGPDQPVAGRSESGEAGWAHVFACDLRDGGKANVVAGWSKQPVSTTWKGGEVVGAVAPGMRLVSERPLAGLQASARPDPANIPNNHLAYAVQWFLFALTALVIYALALRKRLAQSSPERGGGSPQD